MAFGLLAGIAGAFPAIQSGIELQKSRDQAGEDRKYALEQRDAARADRAFGLQQRDRAVTEQKRQDALKAELAGVPQTREIDARPQAVREITVDDDGNPSATQIPAMKTVAAPDWMKFKSTADVYRKNQDFEKADAYEALSKKARFADSAQRFQTVSAGSGAMSLEELGRAAADIYNSDPLPAQIEGMKPVNGGLQLTFANKDTGQSQALFVKSKAELLQKLEAYYSPETYAAAVAKRRDAQAKADETRLTELYKPRVLKPGEVLQVYDPATGGFKEMAQGDVKPGYELVTGPDGSTTQRPIAKSKPEDPFKGVSDALEFIAKNSAFKDQATPVQAATAQRLTRQFFKESPGLDSSIAAEAATDAALNPDKVKLRFDPKTGDMTMAYPFQGGYMIAERLGSAKAPRGIKPEQMRQVATDALTEQSEDMRPIYLAAAAGPKGVEAFRAEAARRLATPEGRQVLQARFGPEPTEEQVKEAIDATVKDAAPTIQLLSTHLDPKLLQRERDRADGKKQPESGFMGGLFGRSQPAPPPPADSPAGRFQARQAGLRESASAADASRAARQAELSTQFKADAKAMTPIDLARKYDSLRGTLPAEDAAALQRIERQIR